MNIRILLISTVFSIGKVLSIGFSVMLCVSGVRAQPTEIHWNEGLLNQAASWYGSDEALRVADNVLLYQHAAGGWPKNIDMATVLDEEGKARIREEKAAGYTELNEPTIDNGATYTQMRFLAYVFERSRNPSYRESFLRGLDYLLEAQYENGGWPQFYPLKGGYYDHITFNDGAMFGVLRLLQDIVAGEPPYDLVSTDQKYELRDAIDRGVNVILQTQVIQEDKRLGWCAQHDEFTLAPAWARAYEPPSLGGSATTGIVRFLMSIESPAPEIVDAVDGAISWLQDNAMYGLRYEGFRDVEGRYDRKAFPDAEAGPLWARFYELETNRPIFLGRDSVFRYTLDEVEQERRSNYSYYGDWPLDLIEMEYPAWKTRLATDGE